jgi:uncharacterized protein YjiS (DUF1127 family)
MAKVTTLISSPSALPPLSRAVFALAAVVLTWEMRRATRRDLRSLDDHLLHDIGLARHRAQHECEKPFWKG